MALNTVVRFDKNQRVLYNICAGEGNDFLLATRARYSLKSFASSAGQTGQR